MVMKSGCARLIVALLLVTVVAAGSLELSVGQVIAQGTQQLVWEGRVVDDTSDLTSGGSIVRVSTIGVADLPIEIYSAGGGWSATNLSGSKPELGPYAAEFAGILPGRYVVTPVGSGATVTVDVDGTDIVVVEFKQVFKYVTPTPAVPALVSEWEAEVVSVTPNRDLRGSVLRVSVVGKVGLLVEIHTETWNATGYTGTKPEYGDYVVEFAGLQKGNYTIKPLGVDTELFVQLDARSFVFVEFRRREGYTPVPTVTATAGTPVSTGTATPVPSPVVLAWTGRVVSNTSGEEYAGYLSTIRVFVDGMTDLPVEIKSGGWTSSAVTGSKPEYGDFAVEFGGLSPSTYTVTPQGLGVSVEVDVEGGGLAIIEFARRAVSPAVPTATGTPAPAPKPTPTPRMVWASRLLWNSSGPEATGGFFSAIQVTVQGSKGLPVEIKSGGWSSTALTGSKPDCGEFCLEFGGLSGSTYTITPQGLGVSHVVTVDGSGKAAVEFYQTLAQGGPLVWTGTVEQNVSGAGSGRYFATIQVIVDGKKWLPVEIKAGGWSSTAETGTKPECGEYCLEFGGLAPATYTITPEGLGTSVTVTVDGGGLALVRFTGS
jgi:hypothetical protein